MLMVGIQSHGQSLETALSQIACEELGIDPERISVRHGDTESTAFGFGTFASRSMVMSGGAAAREPHAARQIMPDRRPPIAMRHTADLLSGRCGPRADGLHHNRRDRGHCTPCS